MRLLFVIGITEHWYPVCERYLANFVTSTVSFAFTSGSIQSHKNVHGDKSRMCHRYTLEMCKELVMIAPNY